MLKFISSVFSLRTYLDPRPIIQKCRWHNRFALPLFLSDTCSTKRKCEKIVCCTHPTFSNQEKTIILPLIFICSFLFGVIFLYAILSTLFPASTSRFSEERAMKTLESLAAVGPRVSGSEAADVVTVRNLVFILNEIKNSVNGNNHYNLEIDVQKPYGMFQLGSHASVYMGISNVIAKLEPKDKDRRTNDSFLVNCHFDSFPGSPGATDDLLSCVSMLEIIRVIYANNASVLRNPIVFLFNGAEEINLGGSTGFVLGSNGEGHPWSRNLRGFINLEGAGAGGKELLFQTGPRNSWIVNAYRKAAKHPFTTVLAEEAFQRGLIPSDTDFRIFRDFRNIPGLDMAFLKNGWAYHTSRDKVSEISPGSMQHLGDNILALVEYLGSMDYDEVKSETEEDNMVFFDVFGLFVVCYTETQGKVLNAGVAMIYIIIVFAEVQGNPLRPIKAKRLLSPVMFLTSTAVAWTFAVGAGAFSGALLNLAGYYRPYHSYPFLAYAIFGVPAVLAQSIVYAYIWKGSQERSWEAGKFSIAVLLLCISQATRSAYILALITSFAILARISRRFILLVAKTNFYTASANKINLVIGDLIPFLYISHLLMTFMDVFVPIMGHYGAEANPNLFFGVVTSAATSVLAFNGISAYFVTVKKAFLILGLIGSMFLVNPLIAFGIIGGIPFREQSPMRIRILETDRTWYDASMGESKTDAGFWIWPQDPNTMVYLPEIVKAVPQLRNYEILNVSSCADLYCSQPIYRWPIYGKEIIWVKTSYGLPRYLKATMKMALIKNEIIGIGLRNITVRFQGPPQSSIAFRPAPNWKVKDCSLGTLSENFGTIEGSNYPEYFINLGKGYAAPDFQLSLVLQDESYTNGTSHAGEVMDVFFVGHIMHNIRESNFTELVQKFPSWTTVQYWTSIVKQYKIST